jgi:hypothetical protein
MVYTPVLTRTDSSPRFGRQFGQQHPWPAIATSGSYPCRSARHVLQCWSALKNPHVHERQLITYCYYPPIIINIFVQSPRNVQVASGYLSGNFPLHSTIEFNSKTRQNGFYNDTSELCAKECYCYLLLFSLVVILVLVCTQNISVLQIWAP